MVSLTIILSPVHKGGGPNPVGRRGRVIGGLEGPAALRVTRGCWGGRVALLGHIIPRCTAPHCSAVRADPWGDKPYAFLGPGATPCFPQ